MTYPENPAMGLNISRVDTYGPGFQTLDLMRQADGWRILDFNGGFVETLNFDDDYLDANGWPQRMPDGADTGSLWFTRVSYSNDLPNEPYVLTYEGEAMIEVSGTIISQEPGRIVFLPDPPSAGDPRNSIVLYVEEIDASDPITDIAIYREVDEALVEAGEIWRPTYLDQVGEFRVIRPMDFLETNSSDVVEWDAARESLDNAIWTEGAPMAAAVDLANTVNADLWINIPHLASDDYVREMARFIAENLDPELRVIVEYSNEHWTTIFDQFTWFIEQGIELFGDDAPLPGAQFYVYRAAQTLEIFNDAFGDPDRVETVLTATAGFAQSPEYLDVFLNAPDAAAAGVLPPNQNPIFEAIAVDTYFDSGLIYAENEAQAREWFATLPEDEARELLINAVLTGEGFPSPISFEELAENYRTFAEIAEANGWNYMSYEGGSFLIVLGGDDPAYTEFLMSLNRDPRIIELNERIFETFIAEGGGLIAAFADTGYDGPFGNWSSWDTGFDTEPNFRGSAFIDFNNRPLWYDDDGRDGSIFLDDRLREDATPGRDIDGTDAGEALNGGRGDDTIDGFSGRDILRGAAGDDSLRGGSGADELNGGLGDDTLVGNAGNDVLLGGAGQDDMRGQFGNDTINGGGGDDMLVGGAGHDDISGGAGNDRVVGSNGTDMLSGESGRDTLVGGNGADRLSGGSGNDRLMGGAGNDTLSGNAGDDVFVFGAGGGDDEILDFVIGEDVINVRALGPPDLESRLDLQAVGGDALLTLDGGSTTVLIRGVTPDELMMGDAFVF